MIKVIWSYNASQELLKITKYWNKRNRSNIYSKKLKLHINISINLIKRNPNIGINSNIKNVKMRLVLQNYYLIYQVSESQIEILEFWDVRQNPIKTIFK